MLNSKSQFLRYRLLRITTNLVVTYPILILIFHCSLLKPVRAEWVPIGPFGQLLNVVGDGHGRFSSYEMPNDTLVPYRYYVSQYSLTTGQRLWRDTIPEWLPNNGSEWVVISSTSNHVINSFYGLYSDTPTYSIIWDSTGRNFRSPTVIDSTRRIGGYSAHTTDTQGRVYYVYFHNRVGLLYWRLSATGVIDKRILLDTSVSESARNFIITPDEQGGVYLWSVNVVNLPIYHHLWHIDGQTDSVCGPVQFRITYNPYNTAFRNHSALYAWSIHKLVLVEEYWVGNTELHLALEIDPLTFQVQHITPFQSPLTEHDNAHYCQTADTIWQVLPVYGRDSTHAIYCMYTLIQALSRDSIWVTTDTISNNLLPNASISYLFTATNNELLVISNYTTSWGVVRRNNTTVRDKPVFELPNNSINIFPNPTNGWVSLEGLTGAKTHWVIYNLLGQKKCTGTLTGRNQRVSFQLPSSLASGSYWLHFEDKQYQQQTTRIQLIK